MMSMKYERDSVGAASFCLLMYLICLVSAHCLLFLPHLT